MAENSGENPNLTQQLQTVNWNLSQILQVQRAIKATLDDLEVRLINVARALEKTSGL